MHYAVIGQCRPKRYLQLCTITPYQLPRVRDVANALGMNFSRGQNRAYARTRGRGLYVDRFYYSKSMRRTYKSRRKTLARPNIVNEATFAAY
jgi:hypothetical protein